MREKTLTVVSQRPLDRTQEKHQKIASSSVLKLALFCIYQSIQTLKGKIEKLKGNYKETYFFLFNLNFGTSLFIRF